MYDPQTTDDDDDDRPSLCCAAHRRLPPSSLSIGKAMHRRLQAMPDLVEMPSAVASCNDLLLLCPEPLWSPKIYYHGNPFTQDWVLLPPAPFFCYSAVVGLICDNSAAAAAAAARYTVLRIACLVFGPKLKVHILSSDTGEWRVNEVYIPPRAFDGQVVLDCQIGIPFNGLSFWLIPGQALLGLDPYDGGQFRHFIYFPEVPYATMNCRFGVCMGRLRLFQVAKDPLLNVPFMCIWDLKNLEDSEWVLEKQVYFRDMVGASKYRNFGLLTKDTMYFSPQMLGCVPDDGDVIHIIALNIRENVCKVVSYNMRMGTLEEVCDIPSNHVDALYQVNTCKFSWWPTSIPTSNLTFATWP